MGIILSYFTPTNDDPDPVTKLTSRDKNNLTSTWQKLTKGTANLETGMTIFLNLFQQKPEYQSLFPFRNVPLEELKQNNKFKAHCISIMYAFKSIMDNIGSPEILEQLAAKQGAAHVPRNVPDVAYEDLKNVLMEIFTESMNQEELKSWEKFLDLFVEIVVTNAEKYRNL